MKGASMSKNITTTVRPSRRTLLKTVGAVGVAAAGGVLSRQVFSPAIAAPAPKIRLAWTEVAACHSPLGFGVAKGIYAKHNLDVELFYQGASGQTLIQALATGKADAGAGLIGDWLKPLEQGFDVKLFVGSHGGCQRLLASQASGIKDLAGVKGKTIATYGIGAPPQVAFQVTLFKAGIDPETDVTWKAVPFDLVGESVNRGDADLAAHLDPWAYSIEKQFNFTKIADTQTGVYQNHTCCVLAPMGHSWPPTKTPSAGSPRLISKSTNTPPIIPMKWRNGTSKISSPQVSPKRRSLRSLGRSSTIITQSVRRSPIKSASPRRS
jgi:NitT/TauT family transport system substrate-binding protein